MLTTLLSTLQSSLTTVLPKPFLISSVLPIGLFLGASYAMALAQGGWLRQSAEALNPLGASGQTTPWNVTFGIVGVFSIAMLWSGAIGLLLELLEGRHLGWLGRWLHACERERLLELDRQINGIRTAQRALERAPSPGAARPYDSLVTRLQHARNTGRAKGPPPVDLASGQAAPVRKPDMRAVNRVLRRARFGRRNTYESLDAAVDRLEQELAVGQSDRIDQHHHDLLVAIDEARERLRFDIQHLLKERQFEFPSAFNAKRGESALAVLAPTRFGNVGLTIRSYAVDRYGMDLDIFWGRLQRVLPAHEKTYPALQDAKIQVDFIASLFWLTILFAGTWSVICGWIFPSPTAFVAVTVIAPIAARLIYLSAVQNYMLFADQVRSAVDMHRFELLSDLRVAQPPGNREEVLHWQNLGEWIGYGNDTDVSYTEKKT